MIGLNGGTLGNTGDLMNNDHDKVIMGLLENGVYSQVVANLMEKMMNQQI
jgi:hypothetical protein